MEGTPQQPPPAGWYPDPNGEGLRYWDGTAWTGHTAPAGGSGEAQGGTAAADSGQAAAGTGAEQTAAASGGERGAVAGGAAQQQQPVAASESGVSPQQHGSVAATAPQAEDRASGLEWTLSILFALVIPLVGLIWGVYLKRQGGAKEAPGNVALVLSLVVILIAVLLLR